MSVKNELDKQYILSLLVYCAGISEKPGKKQVRMHRRNEKRHSLFSLEVSLATENSALMKCLNRNRHIAARTESVGQLE